MTGKRIPLHWIKAAFRKPFERIMIAITACWVNMHAYRPLLQVIPLITKCKINMMHTRLVLVMRLVYSSQNTFDSVYQFHHYCRYAGGTIRRRSRSPSRKRQEAQSGTICCCCQREWHWIRLWRYSSYWIGLWCNVVGYDVERVKVLEPLASFPLGT